MLSSPPELNDQTYSLPMGKASVAEWQGVPPWSHHFPGSLTTGGGLPGVSETVSHSVHNGYRRWWALFAAEQSAMFSSATLQQNLRTGGSLVSPLPAVRAVTRDGSIRSARHSAPGGPYSKPTSSSALFSALCFL